MWLSSKQDSWFNLWIIDHDWWFGLDRHMADNQINIYEVLSEGEQDTEEIYMLRSQTALLGGGHYSKY